ncbi:MAG: carbohydrate binding domain-containing protein [Verrucomicrobiota bacterium]|nr:carbohydrate binding domain-containing protein [Verrucomicrobiota bacterium]
MKFLNSTKTQQLAGKFVYGSNREAFLTAVSGASAFCSVVLFLFLPLLSAGSATAAFIPFVLPYDDASESPASFTTDVIKPAGSEGRLVTTPDGHFAVGGKRLRLFGVNIGASSNFPSATDARAISGRLAKFGFNSVRFHHLDQSWGTPGLIDYAAGDSRSLDAISLDRFDTLTARLKEQGIFWNINLLVSRRFSPADGLPAAIDQLNWKQQQSVGMIRQDMRALQKEYASQLLEHVNPYTGQTYASDPALAIVEIMNENGLIHSWYDGTLNAWPQEFANDLALLWNQWLQQRHTSHAALLAAWGVVDEPLGANLVTNGNFANGTTGWNLEQHASAAATATVGTYEGRYGVRVETTAISDQSWHVQFNRAGISLTAGQLYTFSFWVRPVDSQPMNAAVMMAHDPWQAITPGIPGLFNGWQKFSTTFRAPYTDANMRVNFGGMGSRLGSIYLADVQLQPGGQYGTLPEGVSLSAGNIPILLHGSNAPAGEVLEWVEFLRETETNYWQDMRDYVRNTVGYPGVIVGTINSCSPANVQASVFDATDSHAYWQHPQFAPGQDWSPYNWTVSNVSMLASSGGTIPALAGQRVRGKPHLVTEYQHPSPNEYGAEGPLLIAAYGCLQDWDGIYLFDYGSGSANWNQGYFDGFFNMNGHPTKMANCVQAARLFRDGIIQPASDEVVLKFDPDTELQILATQGSAWNVANATHLGLQGSTALTSRVALSVGPAAIGFTQAPAGVAGNTIRSSQGELTWTLPHTNTGAGGDYRGNVVNDSPRCAAFLGFTGPLTAVSNGITISPNANLNDWQTVTITATKGSLAGRNRASQWLVVTTAKTENTGMVWTSPAHVSVDASWGRAPSLIEPVAATLTLPYPASRVQAWALDTRGQKGAALTVTPLDASTSSLTLGDHATLWYTVEIASSSDYEGWRNSMFSAEQLLDPAQSGDDATPAGDGCSNYLKYLTGLNPSIAGSPFYTPTNAPRQIQTAGNSTALVLYFQARPDALQIGLRAEYSTDLINWTAITPELYSESTVNTYRLTSPTSAELFFVRLRAE